MRKLNGVRKKVLFVSLSLIITLACLISTNPAGAQTFDSMLLLPGQTASSSTTASNPSSFHTIWITDIGNKTLTASISGPKDATGLAWVMIYGTGGRNWGDFNFGPVPNNGISTAIDISGTISFAVAVGGLVLSSEVSADKPAGYTINIGH